MKAVSWHGELEAARPVRAGQGERVQPAPVGLLDGQLQFGFLVRAPYRLPASPASGAAEHPAEQLLDVQV